MGLHGHAHGTKKYYRGPDGRDGDAYIAASWVPLNDGENDHESRQHLRHEFERALKNNNFAAAFAAWKDLYFDEKEEEHHNYLEVAKHLAIKHHNHKPHSGLRPFDNKCLRVIKVYAWIMDGCIPIPCTRRRFGLGPILGIVPVFGDIVEYLISSSFLWVVPWLVGMPLSLQWEMFLHLCWVSLIALIPWAGALYEGYVKPNLYVAHFIEGWLELRSRMADDEIPPKLGSWWDPKDPSKKWSMPNDRLLGKPYGYTVAYNAKFWYYIMGDKGRYHVDNSRRSQA